MSNQIAFSSQENSEMNKAALGFYTESVESEKVSEFEFLFTRAIEFRQETIYFIVVDRFLDGEPNNNSGLNPELYDPNKQQWGKYWGGDLQGIINKLDYLQQLGITAIWVTPLFEQVEALQLERAAMHGYWTKDFKRINPRFLAPNEDNSLTRCKTLKNLIDSLHQRGMKLILDIVCNHSSPDVSGEKGKLYDDGVLIADYYNDSNSWYYHNPEITEWDNQQQVQEYELCGLATFQEENSDYRDYIKTAIKQWLSLGIDGLRIDTIKHMPLWFWQEFTSDIKNHKPSVFIFGEWIHCHPLDGQSAHFSNHSGMSILDFGLAQSIRNALGSNNEGGFYLIQDIFNQDYLYNSATELITFVDNHDMPRFLSLNADHNRLALALGLIMTCRGIPCIYYGTEQYIYNNTNGGHDPYNRPMMENWNQDTPIYQMIQKLSKLRRLNPAVSLGSQIEKYISNDVYCYLRRYRDSRCFVAMNKGDTITIDVENVELEDGQYYCLMTQREIEVKDGKINGLFLESQELIVISYIGDRVKGKTIVRAQLNGIKTEPGESIVVTGNCPELGNWNVTKAYALEYINDNTWFGEIPFTESAGKAITYKYMVVRDNQKPIRENIVSRRWILVEKGTVKWQDTWCS